MVGCGLYTQDPGTAAHSRILTHSNFRRHGQRNLDRLSRRERAIGADERAAGAQIQGEPVPGLPIVGLQLDWHLVLLKAVPTAAFDAELLGGAHGRRNTLPS